MEYYDPNDLAPRRWAILVTVCYALLLGASFAFVSFDFSREPRPTEEFVIELYEPPTPPPPVVTPRKPSPEPRRHEVAAPEERTAQVEGADEQTRTPNPKALFKMY